MQDMLTLQIHIKLDIFILSEQNIEIDYQKLKCYIAALMLYYDLQSPLCATLVIATFSLPSSLFPSHSISLSLALTLFRGLLTLSHLSLWQVNTVSFYSF
jgi:hypothetical protein